MSSLAANVAHVQERVTAAATRAGRNPNEVHIVAVSKTHPASMVVEVAKAGITTVGENRVQEAKDKQAEIAEMGPSLSPSLSSSLASLSWAMIGHLQRNKIKPAVELFGSIHSLDNVRLATALNRHLAEREGCTIPMPVFVQVNVSGEASKGGLELPNGVENSEAYSRFLGEMEEILALPHLHVCGLMTMAPWLRDPVALRPVFRNLRLLRDNLAARYATSPADWSGLSMGMTDDFEIAIEEGATHVRIGRAIFGERACRLNPAPSG